MRTVTIGFFLLGFFSCRLLLLCAPGSMAASPYFDWLALSLKNLISFGAAFNDLSNSYQLQAELKHVNPSDCCVTVVLTTTSSKSLIFLSLLINFGTISPNFFTFLANRKYEFSLICTTDLYVCG